MNRFNYTIALLGSAALLTAPALAAPPIGIGVGAGVNAGARVGAPPVGSPHIGVPSVGVPPVAAPPLSRPAPAPQSNVNASARADAASHLAGVPLHGTLTAISGTTVTVRLASGTVKTYTVSAQTAQALRAYLDKPISFTANDDTLVIAGRQGAPPMHATVSSVTGASAILKLANGATRTYTVTSAQSAWLAAHVGKRVVFWTKADGSLEFDQSSRRSSKH